jgi:transcriptional regulator with XRE-family HTH domain
MKTIRSMREARGLSQNHLARLAGIDASTLSKIERGQLGVGVRRARRLAAVLRVSPWLILEAEPARALTSPRRAARPRIVRARGVVPFDIAWARVLKRYAPAFRALAEYDRIAR